MGLRSIPLGGLLVPLSPPRQGLSPCNPYIGFILKYHRKRGVKGESFPLAGVGRAHEKIKTAEKIPAVKCWSSFVAHSSLLL